MRPTQQRNGCGFAAQLVGNRLCRVFSLIRTFSGMQLRYNSIIATRQTYLVSEEREKEKEKERKRITDIDIDGLCSLRATDAVPSCWRLFLYPSQNHLTYPSPPQPRQSEPPRPIAISYRIPRSPIPRPPSRPDQIPHRIRTPSHSGQTQLKFHHRHSIYSFPR